MRRTPTPQTVEFMLCVRLCWRRREAIVFPLLSGKSIRELHNIIDAVTGVELAAGQQVAVRRNCRGAVVRIGSLAPEHPAAYGNQASNRDRALTAAIAGVTDRISG